MLKFFRHIRQRMIKENRVSKYLLYAIGEIVLVVIGILIALQINIWNEERKERTLELMTLTELHASFETDLNDINFNIGLHESGLFACEMLLVAFEQAVPYNDSLDQYFGQFYNISVFINSTGAYETLKSRGMDIISNDSLRRKVVRMYDLIYYEIKENERSFDYIDLQENKRFMLEQMTHWEFFRSAKPKDYDKISKDPHFRNRLEYTVQVREMFIDRYLKAKRECESVLVALENEIDTLKD